MSRARNKVLAASEICLLHDRSLSEWYAVDPSAVEPGEDLTSLVRSQHFCNFRLWGLEDEARRTDVADSQIAQVKRAIDRWNQQRNDLIERVDDRILSQLTAVDAPGAEQHSETAGQIIDRLSILSLKLLHMARTASTASDAALASECNDKVSVLDNQRGDLARCLERLIEDFVAGRRFFKSYRQFKMYNDPRLNPALAIRRG